MIKYDVQYHYNLLRIQTEHAKKINEIRWEFVKKHIPLINGYQRFNKYESVNVLDYGCGVGWFAAFKPGSVYDNNMDTFDISPVPQTGIRHDNYVLLTLWDVLEHIPDFTELAPLLKITEFVAITIPIKPDDVEWIAWKHFKPGEHLHYYDLKLLQALFGVYGFKLLEDSTPECPPRLDIHSMIFERISNGKI
jgi:hypothetical protein